MNLSNKRIVLQSLSLAALIFSLAAPTRPLGLLLMGVTLGAALIFLYRNIAQLSGTEESHPKTALLRGVTLLSIATLLVFMAINFLAEQGSLSEDMQERLMIAAILLLMIVFGNIAPRLPFNRHTGLRLPWTVSDEETWIVAHRITGYLSLPLALLTLAGYFLTEHTEIVLMLSILLWVGIPSAYSLLFYLRKTKGKV